jgi:hypothetical protein
VRHRHCGVLGPSILAGLLFGGWFGPALTQQPSAEQKAAIRQACRSDFMSHCAGVQPGGREAFACLQRNDVSAACRSALNAVAAKPATEGDASPPPASNQAPEQAAAPPPPTPMPAPVQEGATSPPPPAPPPAASGRPGPQQLGAVRAACRSDFSVHCPGVKPGGSAALRCLQVNAPALSPECRNAVTAMGEDGPPPPAAAAPPMAPEAAPVRPPLGTIPPMRPRQALAILQICGVEQETLCGDVPAGGGRIIACLAANAPRLSPACYNALASVSR